MNEYIEALYDEKPKIVMLQGGSWGEYDGEIKNYVESEKYELIYSRSGMIDEGPLVFIKY